MKEENKSKFNFKLICIIFIIIVICIICVYKLIFLSKIDKNILSYSSTVYSVGSNTTNIEKSILKSLNYSDNYIIIKTYSEYEKICNDIKNSGYNIDFDSNISQEFFNSNSLIIADDYIAGSYDYDFEIKEINYKNSTVTFKICVDYSNGSALYKSGNGSLTFIQFSNQEVKNVILSAKHTNVTKDTGRLAKPVIYIYPEFEKEISVKLGNDKNLTCIYPNYKDGWTVVAEPDGTLTDKETGKKYYSLYYEGINNISYIEENFKEGFVVKSEGVASFLEEKLAILGLNYKETEEFIIYWLPKLQEKEYVYIRFQTIEEIEKNMPLYISEKPDTLIRIMMEWKGLDKCIEVQKQELSQVERKGFTVVEWGGTEIH
jgi:hypothetical protein